jgi:hypothetical protein
MDHSTWKPDHNHVNRGAFMPEPKHVLAEPLETCLPGSRTGLARGGNRERGSQASGSHSVRELAHLNRHAVECS